MSLNHVPPKTVAVVGAVCVTTGWLLASLLAPPVAKLQSLPERRASRPAPAAAEPTAAFTEQLHLRLQHAPAAPTPRRNPFSFGNKPRGLAGSSSPSLDANAGDVPAGVAPPIEMAAAPTGPIFSLAGIGASAIPGGLLFTAVLSDGKTVHLVRTGEEVGGYSVIAVTEDSVTLADSSGQQTILRLR